MNQHTHTYWIDTCNGIKKVTFNELLSTMLGFRLDPNQSEWISKYKKNHLISIDGKRGSGRTSVGLALLLAKSLYNDASSTMYVGENNGRFDYLRRQAEEFLKKLKIGYPIVRNNRSEITFSNGSKIFFRTISPNAGRGMSLNTLFIDVNVPTLHEVNAELITSLYPCIITTRGKILISTEK